MVVRVDGRVLRGHDRGDGLLGAGEAVGRPVLERPRGLRADALHDPREVLRGEAAARRQVIELRAHRAWRVA